MKKIWLDTETTGLDPQKHGIIQIAGIIEIQGKEPTEFNFRCQPFEGKEITQKALETHGISMEEIKEFPKPHTVFTKLVLLLQCFVDRYDRSDKLTIYAYNAPFDVAFLRQFWLDNSDVYFGSYFWHPPIDVMVLAAEALRNERRRLKSFSLISVAKYLGIEFDETEAHDALFDVRLTKKVYEKIQG